MVVEKPLFDLDKIASEPRSKWLDWMQCWSPSNDYGPKTITKIDFTTPLGAASGIFFSLMWWLPKEDWEHVKIDESIEVSPVHTQYYQLIHSQKQQLEEKIRQGLSIASQIMAEYEMLLHDLRKYREVVDAVERNDEHVLRSIFIDQVDIHTGEGSSLRSIAPRWPTIIYDFMRVGNETDPDKIAEKLNIAKAEAVILASKNRLFLEWKEIFGKEAKERYERLKSLLRSKKKLLEEYKNWLKPYVARYKMIKLVSGSPGGRSYKAFTPFETSGHATYEHSIVIWAWQNLRVFELGFIDKYPFFEPFPPYDKVIRDVIRYGKLTKVEPLSSIYPFLLKKLPKEEAKKLTAVRSKICSWRDARFADKLAEEIIANEWFPGEAGWNPHFMYYEFMEINACRFGLRIIQEELEDLTFTVKMYMISQNVLLLKRLEYRCRMIEFERYISQLLGEESEEEIIDTSVEEQGFKFPKPRISITKGPYITQYKQQIERHFFKKLREDFEDVRGFLLNKGGVV